MKLIDKEVYSLYEKHGSECSWTYDSRVSRPKGTSVETDKLFFIIEEFKEDLLIIKSGLYSQELVNESLKKIESMKRYMSDEVIDLIHRRFD